MTNDHPDTHHEPLTVLLVPARDPCDPDRWPDGKPAEPFGDAVAEARRLRRRLCELDGRRTPNAKTHT
jgi:hypothetical protein